MEVESKVRLKEHAAGEDESKFDLLRHADGVPDLEGAEDQGEWLEEWEKDGGKWYCRPPWKWRIVRRCTRRVRRGWRRCKHQMHWGWSRNSDDGTQLDESASLTNPLSEGHRRRYSSLVRVDSSREPLFANHGRTATLSVEYLKDTDRRPMHLAWGMFIVYVVAGVLYFMVLKGDNFRDAIFQIINSLSAVSYGNFDPSTPLEQALTVLFLFFGVGFVGTFVGMIASRRLDFHEEVKTDWLREQQSRRDAELEDQAPGLSLLDAHLRSARMRFFWNIVRILMAIVLGTVVLVPLEGWGWGYAIFFSSQMIMGAGWVDIMPQTEPGKWFVLFYALTGSILIYHALGDLATIPLTVRQSKFEAEVLAQYGSHLTHEKLESITRRAIEIQQPKPSKAPDQQQQAQAPTQQHPSSVTFNGPGSAPPPPPHTTSLRPPRPPSIDRERDGSSLYAPAAVERKDSVSSNGTCGSVNGGVEERKESFSADNTSSASSTGPATAPRLPSSSSAASLSSSSSPGPDASAAGGSTTVPSQPSQKTGVRRDEFVISMMLLLGRVDMAHVREAQKVFDNLDKDKTGVLNEADIVKHVDNTTGLKFSRYSRRLSSAAGKGPPPGPLHKGHSSQAGSSGSSPVSTPTHRLAISSSSDKNGK